MFLFDNIEAMPLWARWLCGMSACIVLPIETYGLLAPYVSLLGAKISAAWKGIDEDVFDAVIGFLPAIIAVILLIVLPLINHPTR